MQRIILHTSEPSSGAARYVSELVYGLIANGAEVTLFCPPTFEFLHDVEASGAKLILAGHRSVGHAGFVTRVARNVWYLVTTAFRQLLATQPGDVLHFQFPLYFPAGLVFFALAWLRGCPIVFTAHDPKPHKWLLPKSLRLLEWSMVRFAYSISNRVIVHNETGKEVLVREFRQSPEKIAVVPHGPLRASLEIGLAPSGPMRLLVFGSIRENKGVRLAIEAVQSLNSSDATKVGLTIAGTVANAREQSYWADCKALIARSPRGIQVMEQYVPGREVGKLISEHHALLLPYSNFTSESGVAALALANGRAIIATRAGGLGEILAQCDCGIPIETATAEGVREAIRAALQHGPEALQKMGEAGGALMDSGRSWVEIGEKTLAVYAAVSQDRPALHRRLLHRIMGGISQ
jgi:glycogen(starch) synthase